MAHSSIHIYSQYDAINPQAFYRQGVGKILLVRYQGTIQKP